jgi:glycosyltransferase involved in cell wall biosynthesis
MHELPAWELWLAGEGDITGSLKDLSKKLGLVDQVKFLGWVAPDDLPSYWNQARLGINLLEKSSVSYYYSLANKFFDYISAGLPSLNMDFPEYVKVNDRYSCAILIHDASPVNIIEAVRDIDLHPEKWNQMAQACEAASLEFTWEKESQRLIGLYESL